MDTDYVIRLAQAHESFRRPELEALSTLANLPCKVVEYAEKSPFCIVRFDFPSSTSSSQLSPLSPSSSPSIPSLPSLPSSLPSASAKPTTTSASLDDSVPSSTQNGTTTHDHCSFNNVRATIDQRVRAFEARSILSKGIYEIWGQGTNYDELHRDVAKRSRHLWDLYKHHSFKFVIDCYGSSQDADQQRRIINSFSYLGLEGDIKMKNPDVEFAVMEEWLPLDQSTTDQTETETTTSTTTPNNTVDESLIDRVARTTRRRVFLTRKIGTSQRWLREKHDLKKRPYISTTSMDAELALVTANIALASPGKIFLDPFVGTGGFMVAAAELGAWVLGSDIDGRSYRGKGTGLDKGVGANFKKYGLTHLFGDCISSDLTNTPFRKSGRGQTKNDGSGRWLDGIVCDPPYGVREGLKVLGARPRKSVVAAAAAAAENGTEVTSSDASAAPKEIFVDGVPAHKLPGYVAPKKPYSFSKMLDDILDFAADTLVDGGRLAFWMPSVNENEAGEEEVTVIPQHPLLELKHECVQRFNRWSRRLLVYERRPDSEGLPCRQDKVIDVNGTGTSISTGHTADELNPFRRRYFQPFMADRS
ncbi:tRNA (guanine(10)-N2)-methyltransferase [Exophiala dermatitidis]